MVLMALFGSLPGAEPPPTAESPEPPAPEPAKKEENWTEGAEEVFYYGAKFSFKRVVFCLDTSNSMMNPVAAGGKYAGKQGDGKAPLRRIDLAREELVRTIRALPAATEFAIVFFDGDVYGWPKGRKLKTATGENKKEAIEEVGKKDLVFGTDIIGALEEAFEYGKYGKVDTIIVLTDGAPYTLVKAKDGKNDSVKDKNGKPPVYGQRDPVRSDPKVILETVARLNKKRGIKVHTIALGGNCRIDFLKELAAANGGTFLQVEAGKGEEPSE